MQSLTRMERILPTVRNTTKHIAEPFVCSGIQYFCNTKIDCTETGKHTIATAIIYIRYRIIPRCFIIMEISHTNIIHGHSTNFTVLQFQTYRPGTQQVTISIIIRLNTLYNSSTGRTPFVTKNYFCTVETQFRHF